MEQIGPYTIEGELGRGGMGVVYRARDPVLQREVAIKLLLPEQGAAAARTRARFLREAQALAKLRHPNIVPIHQAGAVEGRPYLVMDLIEGETLQARLDREGPLDLDWLAELGAKLARALAYAHEQGILHRDIKPDNVLLTEAGEPLLTDLGLAKDLGGANAKLSVTGTMLGTPGYWPPEQAAGQHDRLGPHSDLYALGATLYACVTGGPPFSGVSTAEMLIATQDQPPEPPSRARPEVDRALERIVLTCLEKAPADRYTDASALAHDLERYRRGELTEPPMRALALGLAAIAVALLGILAVLITRRDPPPEVAAAASAPAPPTTPRTPTPTSSPAPTPTTAAPSSSAPAPVTPALTPPPGKPSRIPDAKQRMKAARLYSRAMAKFSVNLPGVLKDLNKVILNDPTEPRYFVGRARHHQRNGDHAAALADLTEALRLEPTHRDANLARAVYYMRSRKYEQAFASSEVITQTDPEFASGFLLQGDALTALRRFGAAERAYAQCEVLIQRYPRQKTLSRALRRSRKLLSSLRRAKQ